MWETVELRELRVLRVLAAELHFGRTADRLLLSQSRVSQTVQALERKLGGRLFDRTSRQVSLTALGERVLAEVVPAYEQLRLAFEGVREQSRGLTGTLRVGQYTPLSSGPHMIDIVAEFGRRHPGCRVLFVDTGLANDPLAALRGGHVDLLATRLPLRQPDLLVGPVLSHEDRVLLVARTDPLAGRDGIDYDEIGDRAVSDLPAFPRELLDSYIPPITASGRVLRRVVSRSTEEAMMRIALGELVHPTVGSWLDHHSHPDVVAVPIRDLPPSETGLVRLRALRSPRVEAFLATARDVLAETSGSRR